MKSIYGPMTDERKLRIWELWRRGHPMVEIAKDIEKAPASVYSYLLYHGGIKPRQRHRRVNSLTLEDREAISRGVARGESVRSIAKGLGRCPSTVSRELGRNGGRDKYRAVTAEQRFLKEAMRPKHFRLAENALLKQLVSEKLSKKWSPKQISCWLKTRLPDTGEGMYVSHETIYKSLFIQTRGLLREELKKHLRSKRMFRHAKSHQAAPRGQIIDAIPISERPAEVEDRAVPGHWEGDLIIGSHNSAIATLVERKTRFCMLCKVEGRSTEAVVQTLAAKMRDLPRQLRRSLTWDRGKELSAHKDFTLATDMQVYFCDPRSPWQRGTNENTNGLLRQYFPKGTKLSVHSQEELDSVAAELNERPRETLGFRTPAEVLNDVLH